MLEICFVDCGLLFTNNKWLNNEVAYIIYYCIDISSNWKSIQSQIITYIYNFPLNRGNKNDLIIVIAEAAVW